MQIFKKRTAIFLAIVMTLALVSPVAIASARGYVENQTAVADSNAVATPAALATPAAIAVYHPVPMSTGDVYSLANDAHIQGLALGTTGAAAILNGTPYLQQSGSPTYTIVAHPTSGNSIQISGRGASHYALDLLHGPMDMDPTVNEYTITIRGRVVDAPGGTQVILGGAGNPWNWLGNTAPAPDGSFEFTVTASPDAFEATAGGAAQFASAFRIQTNNTATFIIDDIDIELVALGSTGMIYSLADDAHIQGLALGTAGAAAILNGTPYLQQSGSPTFTIVAHPTSGNSIQVSNRGASHYALDLLHGPMDMDPNVNEYAITLRGSVADAAGTQVILGGAGSPWNWLGNTAPASDGSFEFTVTASPTAFDATAGGAAQFASAFRIQTNNNTTFTVDDIEIVLVALGQPDEPGDNGDETELWLLSADADIQALALNSTFTNQQFDNLSPHLLSSDSPTFTIVESPDNTRAIQVTGRPDDAGEWFGLDIAFAPLNMVPGTTYEFRANGRILGPVPAGAAMQFAQPQAPWGGYAGHVATLTGSEWTLTLNLSGSQLDLALLNQTGVRIATNIAGRGMNFVVDEIEVVRIGEEPVVFVPRHHITFDNASMALYEDYLTVGAQMDGTRVTNHGQDDNFAFRLENVTGNYTSGDGNYLRFDLPEPLPLGTIVQISWYVYVPTAENPGTRNLVGPGLNINGQFGSAVHQPTNTQPIPDLNRTTPMDEWFNTTVEFMVDLAMTNGAGVPSVDFLIFRFRVNDNVQQPSVLYIDDIKISVGGAAEVVIPEWDLDLPSLAEAFAPWFLFGNIYPGTTSAQMNQFNTREAYLHHFNAITAENHHKPDSIAGPSARITRPTPDEFNFAQTDAIVDWAIANDITLVGHAFVWHSQSPNWMFRTLNDAGQIVPLTRAEARDNMEFYIRTLSEHFAAQGTLGAFYSWDVANEVIASGGGSWGGPLDDWNAGDWRTQLRTNSPWYEAYANNLNPQPGDHPSDFIYDAFVFARRYFPYSILYYNDYNEEVPAKRNAIGQMVEQLNERWAHDTVNNPEAVPVGTAYNGRLLVEGIGMQSHYHLGGWTTGFNNIRPAIERFAAATGRVSITELDLTVFFQGGGTPPRNPGDIPAYFATQAEMYARLFGYYIEFANYIPRVSIWGLADHQSWRAVGLPLLFDGNFNAKPAFDAVLEVAENATPPTVSAPVITTTATPRGDIGQRYTTRLMATRNNHSPMLWNVFSGSLPPGLSLHTTTGVIEGVPTQNGTFTFTIAAENMGGSSTRVFTIVIGPAATPAPTPIPTPPPHTGGAGTPAGTRPRPVATPTPAPGAGVDTDEETERFVITCANTGVAVELPPADVELPEDFAWDILLDEMFELSASDAPVIVRVHVGDLNLSDEQLLTLVGFIFNPETGLYEAVRGTFSADRSFLYVEFEIAGVIGFMFYELPMPLLRLTIGQGVYYRNGVQQVSDVAPFISANRTMVPLRLIAEALGATPRWNNATRTAYIYLGDEVLSLPMGVPLPGGLGTPEIVNGRMLVPARFISENFGAVALWNAELQEVTIFTW